ncbi:MAG: sulfatase-like hydrolase/transferase [Planctomycetes bacterium]|nr:sulfatase-like hydrolase/transferase [Planctomycetota bacterium]
MIRHRDWIKYVVATVFFLQIAAGRAADRPNILWITSEDNSPYLGCYGDAQASTPHLDQLAAQGVRYRNAFSSAPVCSAARSTLISGMHASSAGLHNHRSSLAIPAHFQLYPELLRKAGYFCTNNAKTDYNISVQGKRGTTACVVLGVEAIEARASLTPLMRDASADVRVVAAEALAHMGEIGAAKQTLLEVIKTGNPYEGLAAINTLEMIARAELMTGEELRGLLEGTERTDLMERVMDAMKTL